MSSGNKFGRGTSRTPFRPPPQNRGIVPLRPGPASTTKRVPFGQGKGTSGTGNAPAPVSQEESYQLLSRPGTAGRPFAMIIRLQPEFLERLKQAEAEGSEALMKFGLNPGGHEIKVGNDVFKFSSASEPGDLCDIYEQKKGDNGENVLLESGSAWRKLSVQRNLTASEKDRVKKRTEEAEQRQRLRKSILVDPSTQMVIPAAAAVEANGRKHPVKFTKEQPPQKKQRKSTMSPVLSAPKQRPQLITTPVAGNNRMASPASPASPLIETINTGMKSSSVGQSNDINAAKGRAIPEKTPVQATNKVSSTQKDKFRSPSVPTGSDNVKAGAAGSATNMDDLRNFLITLLQENAKGVTLKVVEKAVAEGLSGSSDRKVIEKIIRSIATYHAPGKYLLNPGVEKGNFIDPVMPLGSGKVQDTSGFITEESQPSPLQSLIETIDDKRDDTDFHEELQNILSEHSEDDSPKASSQELKDIDITDSNKNEENNLKESAQTSKDPSSDESDSSSSSGSGSGSDSDSDSSDSSSSDSGSGSGSDSDASSSSDSSMDEHVDIMSDDDGDSKSDSKQRQKRDSRSSLKDDGKEHGPASEDEPQAKAKGVSPNLCETVPASENTNDCKTDPVPKSPDDLLASVFGPDEELVHDTGLNQVFEAKNNSKYKNQGKGRGFLPSQEKIASAYSEDEKGLASQDKDVRQERNHAEQDSRKTFEPSRMDDNSGMLVEHVAAPKEVMNGSTTGYKAPVQKESQKLSSKASDKETVKELTRHGHDSDKRESNHYNTVDDKLQHKNRSLSQNSNKMLPEESPKVTSLQKTTKGPIEETSVKRLYIKQQPPPSVESRRLSTTSMKNAESHEKVERIRTSSEPTIRGKSPAETVRPDRFSDQTKGGVDQSDGLQTSHKKERISEDKPSETSKSMDTQYWQQKDGRDYAVTTKFDSPHMARLSKEPGKLSGTSRQSVGSSDRVRLSCDQAERPIKHVDSVKKKDPASKSVQKETDSTIKGSSGENASLFSKEVPSSEPNAGDSLRMSYNHGRSHGQDRGRPASNEVGELRDQTYDNGPDLRKSFSREDARGKQVLESSNKLVFPRRSSSPDLESSRHSPVKVADDPRSYVNELRNAKRKSEDNESADSDRPKKRVGVIQSRQSQYGKYELPKDNHIDRRRQSTNEMQENATTNSKAASENYMKSDEELEEAKGSGFGKQKMNRAPVFNGSNKDSNKVDTILDASRRQTPESSEVQGIDFFAPYEKKKPELRGSIRDYAEYKRYYQEYKEKYRVYFKLNKVLENHRKEFEFLHKDIDQANCKDDGKKLASAYGKVRKRFQQHYKKRKRMVKVFQILHEELKTIKNRCKEYAEKVGQG